MYISNWKCSHPLQSVDIRGRQQTAIDVGRRTVDGVPLRAANGQRQRCLGQRYRLNVTRALGFAVTAVTARSQPIAYGR